jgi:exosome complex exonuclease DIS3/RRP44
MKVFSNGFTVIVPKFGIERLIRLRDLADTEPEGDFDADNYLLKYSGSANGQVELFQKVKVRIADQLEESTGKRTIKLSLV